MSEPLKSKTSWISTAIVLSAPSRAARAWSAAVRSSEPPRIATISSAVVASSQQALTASAFVSTPLSSRARLSASAPPRLWDTTAPRSQAAPPTL